jgi:hypothetical protein
MTEAPLPQATDRFVESLSGSHIFEDVFDLEQYTDLPEGWLVVATDIQGSTKAIDEGRYRGVNTLGATAIISAINAYQLNRISNDYEDSIRLSFNSVKSLTA